MVRSRRILLYLHTLRHLRWEQLAYRPIRRAQRMLPVGAPRPGEPDPERVARLAAAVAGWGPGDAAERLRRAESVCGGTFEFLNHAETLPALDWRRRYVSHLWSYNLHYFDFAQDLAWAFRATGDPRFARRFEALAGSWIAGAAPGEGDGWEPYPVSLRLVNWTYALLLFGDGLRAGFRDELARSIRVQAAFLARRLELHILANHLQANFKALAVAGSLFADPAGRRWMRVGVRGLLAELREQVLPDGGHFERSPMYHAIVLLDYLECVSLMAAAGTPAPEWAVERIRRMVDAFGVLSRPGGPIHLFNDAAEGVAPSWERLDALASLVVGRPLAGRSGVLALPESGFYGFADPGSGDRIVVDCGDPRPRYQPGHAHCGLLGFELDLRGCPVVVDSGVNGYDGDPFREYVRSTRAHNTVMIGGLEQSEVWGTFRMARRARVLHASAEERDGEFHFGGAYRPYHDRGGAHHRSIRRDAGGWIVTDRVERPLGAQLRGWLHLHPELSVAQEGSAFVARSPRLCVAVEPFGVDGATLRMGEMEPVQGWHCPRFGRAVPAPVIETAIEKNHGAEFGFRIRVLSQNE
jgi:hypothetical protein